MLDENLISTLEQSLRQTRNAQHRLMARLNEVESEADKLRSEIRELENFASQTESSIDRLLVMMGSSTGRKGLGTTIQIEDDVSEIEAKLPPPGRSYSEEPRERQGSVAYFDRHRSVPSRSVNVEALSQRFADRTITQACTLLLREAGRPLHVNELYNLLVAGGMQFKGNNPTISVAVSLNRNRRFSKVGPGTFDLVMREALQAAS
ncbi:MAG: hypothetical protein IPM21_17515 [Acidobacteria bacterium]|nr:hypothetical protein [Acidobacteriota bacterium]